MTASRQQAGWSFSTLFLVKDSLAIMLESAGLLEDALREYAELEALYSTTVQPSSAPNAPPFGRMSVLCPDCCLRDLRWVLLGQ